MNSDPDFSPYRGPVRTATVRAGGRPIHLVRPDDPDRLLDDPAVVARNRTDDYMPYWAYLWPGSFLLGDALAAGDWPERTRALELGCGLGLPGLVALSLGLAVEFTDHDRNALDFVGRSADRNGFDPRLYSAALLDWRQPTPGRFSLILGSDITYERRLIPLVAGVIAAKLAPGGLALITDPDRTACADFRVALHAVGLAVEATKAAAVGEEGAPVRGTIYRITRA